MSDQAPTTITRMFDPTLWGLRKNQLAVFFFAGTVSALFAIIKTVMFPNSTLASVIFWVVVVVVWGFFFLVGLNRTSLYNFERRLMFVISRKQGEELIQKYNESDFNKVKNFTHIKNVYKGGYTEFWPINRGNNWAVYLELFAFSPEDLEVFEANAEKILTGVEDGTIIKTTLKARKSTGDPGEPFKKELKRENQIPLLREICYEQAELCQNTSAKTYKTHMALILPYTTNKTKAFQALDNVCIAVKKALKEQGIENEMIDTPEKVYGMFSEMITHNTHIIRKGIE
jgi:hypothetical protein